MTAKEFELIEQYFSNIGPDNGFVEYGVGDDAAVLNVDSLVHLNQRLLVSADALCENTHFLPNIDPASLAFKALAANVSDILAMGGRAFGFTLCLSMPGLDDSWVETFAIGLQEAAHQFKVRLIGGDTTRGSLTIGIQVFGYSNGKILYRHGAQVGDQILVTGTLGDAAAGCALALHPEQACDSRVRQSLLNRWLRPDLPVGLLWGTEGVNACVDLSDGLLPDLRHLCQASGVTGIVDPNALPLSSNLQAYHENPIEVALTGGEDYGLCMTVRSEIVPQLAARAKRVGITLTSIGEITAPHPTMSVIVTGWEGSALVQLEKKTFLHFPDR